MLVVKNERLVGIFTERDALFRVTTPGRDPKLTRLSEVMTREPTTVTPDETFGYALLVMYEKGFRHLPVIEDGRPVGVLSARHALDPDLEEFAAEGNDASTFAGARSPSQLSTLAQVRSSAQCPNILKGKQESQ